MIKHFKRPVSLLLAWLMIVGIFTALPITTSAENAVSEVMYLDENGSTQFCGSYELFTGQRTWGAQGETHWYVAESDYNRPTPSRWGEAQLVPWMDVYGDVHLIIKDGVKIFNGASGIKIHSGSSLTIYAQSTGSNMGELYMNGTTGEGSYFGNREGLPGIDASGATLTINGGRVIGQAGKTRIGIECSEGGSLIVNGGDVYAYSRKGNLNMDSGGDPEAIGGVNSNITVNGGHVSAQNNDNDNWGYAIGCSQNWGYSNININGGYVEAYGCSDDGHAFGGTLNVADGLYIKAGNVIRDGFNDLVCVENYNVQAKAQVRSLVPVTDMTINKTSTNLVVGKDTEQLSVTSFSPSDATFNNERFVVWSSSDESVATVNQNGLVTPHWEGTATITARITNDTEDESDDATVTCTVNVTVIHISEVPLDKTNLDLFTYSRPVQLTPTIIPEDTSYQEMIWSTSDENVVTVSQKGLVTVQSTGSATVTVRATNGTPDNPSDDKISTCSVTVSVPEPIFCLDYENGKFVKKAITDYVHFDDTSVASVVDGNWGAQGKETFVYVDTVETVNHRINAVGNVHLIIADGASMTINGGIHVANENTLTVHVQSLEKETTGKLTVTAGDYHAGIGSNGNTSVYDHTQEVVGIITINGGIVTAYGGTYAAAIGGGCYTSGDDASTIVFNAGFIKAYGGKYAAGIGGGSYYTYGGTGGNIIVRGGIIESTGTGAISGGTARIGQHTHEILWAHLSVAPEMVIKVGTNIEDAEYFTFSNKDYITSSYAYISLPVAAESISLPETSVTLTGDETISLRPVTFVPVESSYNTMSFVKWTSSDDNIVTVDANGLVRPLRDGTVTITATANNGTPDDPSDDKTATCTVTFIFVEEEVSLEKSTLGLTLNGPSEKLVSTVSPANATVKTLVWTSSNPDVAKVDQNGVVTPVSLGTATITVTATNRTETTEDDKSATCEVSVTVLDVEEITLDKTSVEMEANRGVTVKLNPTIAPRYATYRSADMIKWSSDNPAVATVDQNGVISAHWEGTATITATAINGTPDDPSDDKTATCTVTVSMVHVTEPTLSESEVDINLYRKPYKITATINPDNASYKTYKWESDDPTIATVDQNGYVTPVSAGTTTIRFTATNGSPDDTSDDKTAICTVHIVIPDEISYLDYDAESGEFSEAKTTAYSLVYADDSQWGKSGTAKWYYVNEDITINNNVYVNGNVHLILGDNAALTVNGYINVGSGSTLTIYAQSQDEATMGRLSATGSDNHAGIGGNVVTINGGKINATGTGSGSGIEGVLVTVNEGNIYTVGGDSNGYGIYGDTLIINGGYISGHASNNVLGGTFTFGSCVFAKAEDKLMNRDELRARMRAVTIGNLEILKLNPVTSVTLDHESVTLDNNIDSYTLSATVEPSDLIQYVVWNSSDESIVKVDGNGQLKIVAPGTVTITVTATNGTPDDTSDDITAACVVTIPAMDEVTYLDFDARPHAHMVVEKSINIMYDTLTADNSDWGTDKASDDSGYNKPKWYVVDKDLTFNEQVKTHGNVHLILKDGVTLTLNNGLNLSDSLTVYGQSQDENTVGKLIVNGSDSAGIINHGSLTVNSGFITASGSRMCAGIGGCPGEGGGTVTINGGIVKAYGGEYAAGIGGGGNISGDDSNGGDGGNVTMNGGIVTAISGGHGAYAIGSGVPENGPPSENIGTVTLNGILVDAGDSAETAESVTNYAANHFYPYAYLRPDPNYEVPGLNIKTVSDHGRIVLTKDGDEITSASYGNTVTLNVEPYKNYALNDISVYLETKISTERPEDFVELLRGVQIPGQQEISSYIVTVNYNDHLAVMNGDETIAEVTDGADFWRNSLGDFIFRTSSSSWTIRIANNGVTYIEVIELQHGDFIFRAQNNNGLYNKPKEKVESLKAVTEGETYTFTMPYCDVEVVATYRELYTVTWVNIDGTVLETDDNVEAGTIPEYNSENPVKDSCTFVGWTDGNNTYSINDVLPEVSGNITYKAVFAYADGMSARVVGHTISLDGDIGVNFYMELSPEIAASETAYMHFIIPNGNKTTEVDVPVSQATVKGNYYIFKCNVAAKDMDSTVTGRIIDGETYGTEYTYSVKQYADYLLEHADKNGTEQEKAYADAVPLVEKMLQYGAYAKEYFDKTNTLGNLEDVDIDIADAVIGEFTDGTTFEGVTLSLKSETTLSLYFKSGETLEFTCSDYDVETVISGGYQIARIRGIQAKNIGDMITLNVNGVTVEYSPLNYCRNVLENGNQPDSLKNVVKALYLYWQAAAVYFDVADLSALTGNYEAQDGDILTGTLVGNYKISIADGATVTLKNVNISCLANSSWFAGITLAGDATIILKDNNTVKGGYEDYPGIAVPEGKTLTIEGDGSLDAYSNGYGCGIGGGYNMSGGNIVINGGTITAAGGLYCAGIGSGCRSSCGNITINGGTVTATSFLYSAGIGSGSGGSCGSITINGGTVTATGGESAAGIGSGYWAGCGDITIANTVTQVTATKGEYARHSIGIGEEGSCGTVTIGGIAGVIEESPYTYQPSDEPEEPDVDSVNLSTLTGDYEAQDGDVLTGTLGGNYKITIADGATVTLRKVDITCLNSNARYAGINLLGDATIILKDNNTVKGGYGTYPGIAVPEGKTLTIEGDGSLDASSNGSGSGIGSGYNMSAGNIVINSGTIKAAGGSYSAGIGSGGNGNCGNILITNNVTQVIATKGDNADYSIGSNGSGTCGTVTIGGVVKGAISDSPYIYQPLVDLSTLTGDYEAQDGDVLTGTLGGNYKITIADGATVTLRNADITCLNGSVKYAGITLSGDATIILEDNNTVKGGYAMYPGIAVPEGKTLTIEGDGSLEAYSNGFGSGIGSGYNMSAGNIVINGGTIKATGGGGSAGIGSGWNGNCGNILITSNVTKVTATKGDGVNYSIGSNGSGTCGTVTIGGVVKGTISASPYTYQPLIDLSTLTGDYEVQGGNILTGTLGGDYQITITDGATVTLRNADITCLTSSAKYAGITLAGDATIILEDNNTVKGGHGTYPGIAVPEGKTLTIEGNGSLDASSNGYGSGIGSGYNMSAGNIVINGGTIKAAGGSHSAGIGSGWNGNCGNILITSNVTQVTATKGDDADYSIGSNGSGTCGTVTIGGVEGAIEESPYTYQP